MTDWTQIGSSFALQNLCLYDNLNFPPLGNSSIVGEGHLTTAHFACSAYGGPIAIASPKAVPNSWEVSIFMQNGVKISSLTANAIFRMFWSKCQKLLLVCTNGRVLVYNALGKLQNTFSMGDESLALGLFDAKIFNYGNETGLAVLNSVKHVFAINSVNNPLLWRLQQSRESLQQLHFNCWTVFSNPPKPTKALFCCQNTRFLLGHQESGDGLQTCNFPWARRDGQYLQMEPNHESTELLLLHDSKLVQLVDIDEDLHVELRRIRLDQEQMDIGRLFWCGPSAFGLQKSHSGTDLIAVYPIDRAGNKENQQMMVAHQNGVTAHAPEGEEAASANFTFTFPSPAGAQHFADVDGIRVFTPHSSSLLLPVPASTKTVMDLGSNEPGALLYGAALKLEQGSHLAYEFVRSISAEQMPQAVDDCLAAAGHHFDTAMQNKLLKAASMGIRRCTSRPYNADAFLRCCRLLRVLNALRFMGIPLTYGQLDELGPPAVIDRLVSLGHWPMALRFCAFLELDPREGAFKVLAHWCLALMREHKQRAALGGPAATTERELALRIIERLKQYPAIAYADIAEMASRQELSELASTLLGLEQDVGRQVGLLLKLKKLEEALKKAAQSQNPELMKMVLKHLRSSMSGREVELLIRKVPLALSIYQSEIRDEAPERLLALYEQNDDFLRQAIIHLQRAEQSQDIFDPSKTVEQLNRAEKALRNRKAVHEAQLVGEAVQLILDNVKREERFGTAMPSTMSVRDTFIWAAEREELSAMEQLRKQHRLVDKQVFLWTLQGFAQAGKWAQLEQYLRTKKSPVGYLPVFELCAKMGNKNVALRFMDKLSGYEEQVQAYMILGEVKKAASLAVEKADLQMLQLIRRKFPPSCPQWAEVSRMMEEVAKQK